MVERKKIRVFKGWPGLVVEYTYINSKGEEFKGLCSLDEWKAHEIKLKLVKAGAEERLVDELYDLAYTIGRDSVASED